MTRDELIADGWREYDRSKTEGYDTLYQIKVRDGVGVRYFVNVKHWTSHPDLPPAWEAEVVYNGGCAFHPAAAVKVQAWDVGDWTPAGVRKWAEELWTRLAPNYYERD